MERRTGLGRVVVPDDVVAAIAARYAIATAPVAGLVRAAGPGQQLLPFRHLARGVSVSASGNTVHVVMQAAARFGVDADDLARAAAQTAEHVAAAIGGGVRVDLELRVVAVRQRGRLRWLRRPEGARRGHAADPTKEAPV